MKRSKYIVKFKFKPYFIGVIVLLLLTILSKYIALITTSDIGKSADVFSLSMAVLLGGYGTQLFTYLQRKPSLELDFNNTKLKKNHEEILRRCVYLENKYKHNNRNVTLNMENLLNQIQRLLCFRVKLLQLNAKDFPELIILADMHSREITQFLELTISYFVRNPNDLVLQLNEMNSIIEKQDKVYENLIKVYRITND